jgi:hypothetical protein
MSYESTAEPIKIGYLMDFKLSDDFPQHYRDDLTIPFEMGSGYLVARELEPDGVNSRLVARFGEA